MPHTPKSGSSYFFQGWKLIQDKRLRKFAIYPVVVTFIVLSALWVAMWHLAEVSVILLDGLIPTWLVWLNLVIWPLFFLLMLAITAYVFTIVVNLIAAPFLGLLSERTQLILTGETLPETDWGQVIKETPAMIARQLRLILYYIPRAIICIIIMLIPGLNVISSVVWFCFGSWMLAIQYMDYPLDNNKQSFHDLIAFVKNHRWDCFTFGVCVFFGTMIPLLNIFVIPAAVAGATAFYLDSRSEP